MPGRIPVVLSQASAANADARRLEEDLIAALMFERGVDVSVVPHLTQLNDGTTGLLCLEGIKGDLIVLTWLEPEHARRLLDQRGIRGRDWLAQPAASHGLSRSAATSAAPRLDRRLHILQLDAAAPPAQYVQEVQRLREDNESRIVSPGSLPVITTPPQDGTRPVAPPALGQTAASEAADAPFEPAAEPPAVRPAGTDELDHLLDQLDALDL